MGGNRLLPLRTDITTLAVDAIVNVANASLLGGGEIRHSCRRPGGWHGGARGEADLLASCYRRAIELNCHRP